MAKRHAEHADIRDLSSQMRNVGRQVTHGGSGAVQLAHYRGFQGGYEQAMKDHKNGKMTKDNAMKPGRMK